MRPPVFPQPYRIGSHDLVILKGIETNIRISSAAHNQLVESRIHTSAHSSHPNAGRVVLSVGLLTAAGGDFVSEDLRVVFHAEKSGADLVVVGLGGEISLTAGCTISSVWVS